MPGLFQCHTSLCQTVKPAPHLSQTTHPDLQSSTAHLWPGAWAGAAPTAAIWTGTASAAWALRSHYYPWMGQTLTAPEHSQHPTIQDWGFFSPTLRKTEQSDLAGIRVLLQVTKTLDPLLQQCQHTNFKNFSHSCGQPGNLEAALNDSRVTGRNLSRADISERVTEHPGTQLQCQQTVAVTFWRVSVTTHNSISMENYWCLLHLKPWNTSPPHEGVLNC